MRRRLIVAFAFLVAGCVGSQAVVDSLIPRYIGRNVDAFFIDHGAPAGRHQLNSGDVIWAWDSGARSVYIPSTRTVSGTHYGGVANYSATTYGGGSIELRCVVQIVTARDGIIKSLRITKDTVGTWATSMCHEVL